MSEPTDRTVALVGLPNAGKTTYIVAFFLACETESDGMCITKYQDGNREYLNSRTTQLANCKVVPRTGQMDPGELRLKVQIPPASEEQQLVIPDLSGELLGTGLSTRRLPEEFDELFTQADGAILFVRTDTVVPAETLADFNAAMTQAGQPPAGDVAREHDDWEISMAPTQVRLADAMQELIRRRGDRRVRLAVALSAWDSQKDVCLTPDEWARQRLSLLTQMLDGESNVEWSVFGVSAQGGNFLNPEDVERLKDVDVATRGRAVAGDGTDVGIGAPVRWALGDHS